MKPKPLKSVQIFLIGIILFCDSLFTNFGEARKKDIFESGPSLDSIRYELLHADSEGNAAADGNRIPLAEGRVPRWKGSSENQGPYYGQPEQVHLSYGGDPSTLFVTWLTFDDTLESLVEYGMEFGRLNLTARGKIDYFVDRGQRRVERYNHRVTLNDIQPGIRYFYRVGSKYGWSSVFTFVGLKQRPEGGYRFAVFGDLGNVNARSLGKLQRLGQQNEFDMILHVGDFAYDFATNDGTFGDEFMRQVEPLAAYVPYMAVVGNHEVAYNFSHFINRFTMPNDAFDNIFYSFDVGPIHFVAISTELYYWPKFYTLEHIAQQWNWLARDLEKANKNRKNVPWIIVMGHRPMYCSDYHDDDCDQYNSKVRTGVPGTHAYGFEKLFYKYGVDLGLWAHEHTYERMFPVFNRTLYNTTSGDPYLDSPAPVHVVSGSAGCQEKTDTFVRHPGPWSAFRSSNYGFSILHVFNETHLHMEQTLAFNDTVEDSFWLVKNKHRPYTLHDRVKLQRYGTYIPSGYCHHPSQCVRTHHSDL